MSNKNLANIITFLRIIFGFALLFTDLFSEGFWICYAICGMSDLFDGVVARVLKTESDFGAKLDSAADAIFFSVLIIKLFETGLPKWALMSTAAVAAVRLLSYLIGFIKFKEFVSLHTLLNKATGALIFAFPILLMIFDNSIFEFVICAVALISAVEECIIIIRSGSLDRNCKGIFVN